MAPRVDCREHSVSVAAVPWARHDNGRTYNFDQQVALLASACSKTAVTELMRIAWRTVGSIIPRVWDATAGHWRSGATQMVYAFRENELPIDILVAGPIHVPCLEPHRFMFHRVEPHHENISTEASTLL